MPFRFLFRRTRVPLSLAENDALIDFPMCVDERHRHTLSSTLTDTVVPMT